MNMQQFCNRSVVSVDQGASLSDAARLMRSHHVGALVVTAEDEEGPRVMGLITDRDLTIEILARDLGSSSVRVGQVAQKNLVAVEGDADFDEALSTMKQHGVRRLLIIEPDGQLLGIISSDDLIDVLASQLGSLADAIKVGLAGEAEHRPSLNIPTLRNVFLPQTAVSMA